MSLGISREEREELVADLLEDVFFPLLGAGPYEATARKVMEIVEPSPDVWEAMRDGLQEIVQWADAYPVDVFPEPDLDAVKAALSEAGILNQMDRMHSSWARHLLKGIGDTARTALPAPPKVTVEEDRA